MFVYYYIPLPITQENSSIFYPSIVISKQIYLQFFNVFLSLSTSFETFKIELIVSLLFTLQYHDLGKIKCRCYVFLTFYLCPLIISTTIIISIGRQSSSKRLFPIIIIITHTVSSFVHPFVIKLFINHKCLIV